MKLERKHNKPLIGRGTRQSQRRTKTEERKKKEGGHLHFGGLEALGYIHIPLEEPQRVSSQHKRKKFVPLC